MVVRALEQQEPFLTADGSTIRGILNRSNAPVGQQSLVEATLPAGGATQRHHHKVSEEIYFILEGSGEMDLDGETRLLAPGDAVLIPPGRWHQIVALSPLRLLCCCAPPFAQEDTFFE